MSKSILSSSHASSLFLARFAKIVSTSGGADRMFMIVQYALTLVLPSLQPRTILSSETTKSRSSHPSIKLYLSLKRLRDLCSDYRIFARLLGYPAVHAWGISTYNTPTSVQTGSLPRWIEDTQVMVNLAYQPLENVAYLSSHDILPLSKNVESKLWLWSCRCWAAHVFLDLYRLSLVRKQYLEDPAINKKSQQEREDLSFSWVREVIINLAYAPLTLHWSLERGLPGLTERGVGALGVVAAIGQLSKMWDASK